MDVSVLSGPGGLPKAPPKDPALWQAAQQLEASFLAEMLKSAGLGEARSALGGGAGEAQFSSLLRQEQSRMMVEAGGIGLAEGLYRALAKTGAGV